MDNYVICERRQFYMFLHNSYTTLSPFLALLHQQELLVFLEISSLTYIYLEVYCLVFWNFAVIFLLLISSLIPLWSENTPDAQQVSDMPVAASSRRLLHPLDWYKK